MKRTRITLAQVTHLDSLYLATYRAAKGKRQRQEVQHFLRNLPSELMQLNHLIDQQHGPLGEYRCFTIRDPKTRLIHAADFRYRVLHHAMMAHAGPCLDQVLLPSVFACRINKGVHKAVQYVQQQLRRFPFFVQIDIDGYFPSIDHGLLNQQLSERIKGQEFLNLCQRVINSYEFSPGKGLPIGSLCSQYWANLYLNGFDRFMLETQNIGAYCRYMDDIIWWCPTRQEAVQTLRVAREYLKQRRCLTVKAGAAIAKSKEGASYCGFEIRQGVIHPSRRKRQSYQWKIVEALDDYQANKLSELELQCRLNQAHAVLAHTESEAWRQHVLAYVGLR